MVTDFSKNNFRCVSGDAFPFFWQSPADESSASSTAFAFSHPPPSLESGILEPNCLIAPVSVFLAFLSFRLLSIISLPLLSRPRRGVAFSSPER